MLADLPLVEALGPQILDIGERGGLPWRYVGYIYLGLAAHWRGNAERAEAELRNAVELEPPGAIGGQSVSLLARHLAYQGRAEEVLELFESTRPTLPSLDRASGVGSWNSMFGFVEALYLCGSHEEAAALSPLVEGVLAAGRGWITFDGRLVETRAGIAAAAARRWDDAERYFGMARESPNKCPTGSSWLTWTGCTPGCCWTVAAPAMMLGQRRCSSGAGRVPRLRHARYAAEAERLRSQALA